MHIELNHLFIKKLESYKVMFYSFSENAWQPRLALEQVDANQSGLGLLRVPEPTKALQLQPAYPASRHFQPSVCC